MIIEINGIDFMNPTSALSVASEFIDRSFSEKLRLTNMQVQKMVYIANGLYLALTGNPLIKERVEAWSYGPVIKPLYNELKKFGSGYINEKIDLNLLSLLHDIVPLNLEDNKVRNVLDFTWEMCKNKDGIKLSNWTHSPDSPWTKAMENNKTIIPDEYMGTFFKRFIKQPVING